MNEIEYTLKITKAPVKHILCVKLPGFYNHRFGGLLEHPLFLTGELK